MNNLKISTRLTLAFGLLTALLLVVAATAFLKMRSMQASATDITTNWLPSVEHINRMDTGLSDYRLAEMRHVMSFDDKGKAEADAAMKRALTSFEEEHRAYVKLISSAEEQAIYDGFASDWKSYLELHEKLVALSSKGEDDLARALFQGDAQKLANAASDKLDKLAELNSKGSQDATATSNAAYHSAVNTLVAAACVALLSAVLAAWWLVRSITVPLRHAVTAADSVAAGDLSSTIHVRSSDETGQLLSALQRMQQSLGQTVRTVRANAENVATASGEIAQGNLDLSQRTESQASALQETAASMDQMASTVRQNAENARQASQLAVSASEVATQGGNVVGQVVDTMKRINESSGRIADIIGVIDGIAFQTNILALNAAVEAARAGEQGRGFAVVAGEVRTLAQRSAEAAKEIKSLIHASVERVQEGTQLVDQAGSTMQQIVQSIQRVNDIVGEISNASQEQSAGVAQIGQAVSQLDQTTQQNAALVEESSAAAESLKTQSQQLVATVATFQLAASSATS